MKQAEKRKTREGKRGRAEEEINRRSEEVRLDKSQKSEATKGERGRERQI